MYEPDYVIDDITIEIATDDSHAVVARASTQFNGELVEAKGYAKCNVEIDEFSPDIGYTLASGRALRNLGQRLCDDANEMMNAEEVVTNSWRMGDTNEIKLPPFIENLIQQAAAKAFRERATRKGAAVSARVLSSFLESSRK